MAFRSVSTDVSLVAYDLVWIIDRSIKCAAEASEGDAASGQGEQQQGP
jgi:hypothetical protein